MGAGILLALALAGCGSDKLSKSELKTSYRHIEDQYATVIIDSQTKDMTDKEATAQANKAIDKVAKLTDDIDNSSTNTDLSKKIVTFGEYVQKALKNYTSSIAGESAQYASYPRKSGVLDATISNKYFDGKYSAKMNQMLDILDDSSDSDTETVPTNEGIQSAISDKDANVQVTSVNGSYTDSESTTQIELKGRELLSDKQTEKGMLMDIATVWKAIASTYSPNAFENVGVSVTYPLKDKSGSVTDSYVIKSDLTGAKFAQLDPDGFNWQNVPSFATSWWQSDALPDLK